MLARIKNWLKSSDAIGLPLRRLRNWYNARIKYGIKKFGPNLQCNRGVVVCFHDLEVGHDVFIGYDCYFGVRNIKIGNYVQLAPKVAITGGDHLIEIVGTPIIKTGLESFRDVQTAQKGVTIQDDVWIGWAAVIMDGVTIGEGSVVGAGSIVTKDIPPYSIYAGCPARKIRDRFKSLAERLEHSKKISGTWHLLVDPPNSVTDVHRTRTNNDETKHD